MTITQIKSELGIKSLQLHRNKDQETDEPTEWLRHWDNEERVAVSIHEDTIAAIKADKSISSLAIQKSGVKDENGKATDQRVGNDGPYTALRIVKYSDADEVL